MEFLMDFKKTSICKNVGKFLQDNLKDEKDKESLQNIITEKALLKNDAINLLITILQALTIPDSTGDEEISVVTPVNKDPEDTTQEGDEDIESDESLSQHLKINFQSFQNFQLWPNQWWSGQNWKIKERK